MLEYVGSLPYYLVEYIFMLIVAGSEFKSYNGLTYNFPWLRSMLNYLNILNVVGVKW